MTANNTVSMLQKMSLFLPGLLVAATGVGAGDLATASFTGSQLGVEVLWAVALGGLFKYVLNEGLARWQLATGETFLEGIIDKGGQWLGWLFMPYLLLWTFFVASALMSASGATLQAMTGSFAELGTGKIVWGIVSSLAGLLLVRLGGFRLFERVMMLSIALMFFIVLLTAIRLWPGTEAVLAGLLVPMIPQLTSGGLGWTVALIGGVGGTLTILCYGYWIRESGRESVADLGICRLDLALGYIATVVFGMAMVIIGSTLEIEGSGAALLINLAERLRETVGSTMSQMFLLGAFCAIFSSLLGVWQSVPYLFADLWRLLVQHRLSADQLTRSRAYHYYLWALTLIPMAGLWFSFREVQKFYAIIGAAFMPLLALALLVMNGRKIWLGAAKNGWLTTSLLVATLAFFGFTAWLAWR